MNLAILPAALIARFGSFALGAAAIIWALVVLPKFWTEAAVFQAAARVINGDMYSWETLSNLSNSFGPSGNAARSSALAPLAVVQQRLAEEALARGERDAKLKLASLEDVITLSLSTSPNAPYQWLALFWAESQIRGYDPQSLKYLSMSYEAGPREGWIAIRRNRIALSLYAVLTEDLKDAALNEFVGLVRSKIYADSADIFGNTTPVVKTELIARLDRLKEPDRRAFVKIIYDKGYWDAAVPGVNLVPSRPWRN